MRWVTLALLVLFPIAWGAPLMRAALLPIFGMDEISVLSGIVSLWQTDAALAVLVAVLAVVAPYGKLLMVAGAQFGLIRPLPWLHLLARLSLADIFLIAVYIVLAKGVGHVTVQTAWGLYLFSACVLTSLLVAKT